MILGGIRIGERALVGAGSVVTRDVEGGEVVVGNPARQRLTSHTPPDWASRVYPVAALTTTLRPSG